MKAAIKKPQKFHKKPSLVLEPTTFWDYPSQHYGDGEQGSKDYAGATPSHVIWNLLKRYTAEGDWVVDPMCGSGTTLDVCRDLKRQCKGFDLVPSREDIIQSDARHLPLKSQSADFVFIDPPYMKHIDYSDHGRCIGKLDGQNYYDEMRNVIQELFRVLKRGGNLALYVSDSFQKGKPFEPIGFELFALMRVAGFKPVDIVTVRRYNSKLKMGNWRKAAVDGNFFLRGFNYLFIMQKPS